MNRSTGDRHRRDWRIPAALLLFGAAVWLWFGLNTGIALEDAYITYRYARNVAAGNGFVYNPGERVLGTTTPLQTLLLAGLGAVIGLEHIPSIAAVVMPLFGLAAAALFYLALVRLGAPRFGAAAGCLLGLVHPVIVRTSLGGMETPLVLFFMALGLYLAAARRVVAAAAAVGALVLCRVDGLIWGAVLIGATLLLKPRRPWHQAAAFAAIAVPWVVFAWLYFGSPLPNSMLAKGVIRPGREDLLLQPLHFARMARFWLSGTGVELGRPLFLPWVGLLALGAYAAARRRRPELSVLAVFPVVYVVLMYAGRAPKYEWYLAPMLMCCLLLGGLALGDIAGWVMRGRVHLAARAVVGAGLAAALVTGAMGAAAELPARVRHARRWQENEEGLRRRVGLWLRDHMPRDTDVAMEAIGRQGYFSERRVIDPAGLVTPEVVEYKASTGSNAEVFRRILRELEPDYLVLRSFEVDENRHFNGGPLFATAGDAAWFHARYREARRFAAPHAEMAPLIWHLTVYQRR